MRNFAFATEDGVTLQLIERDGEWTFYALSREGTITTKVDPAMLWEMCGQFQPVSV